MGKFVDRCSAIGYLCLSVVAMATLVAGCADPPQGCSCNNASHLMECEGISVFPDPVPVGVTEILIKSPTFAKIPARLTITDVTQIQIYDSYIDDIADEAFTDMNSLETLIINRNNIDMLRHTMFTGLTSLKKLELEQGSFTELPPTMFSELPALTHLSLDSNKLSITDTTFKELSDSLEFFSCINCNLSVIPSNVFQDMENLKTLHLNKNSFTTIEDKSFYHLSKLTALELDSVGLTTLTDFSFQGLPRLQTLRLSNNALTEIPKNAFHDQGDLIELYLEFNKLESLREDLLEWKKLSHLNLTGNPWRCDCDLYWMSYLHFDNSITVKCASPENLKDYTVHNATIGLNCDTGTDNSTIVLAITIPIIIICVCLLGYCMYKYCQSRRKAKERKGVRYSAVYKETTEAKRPTSEL